MSNIVKCEEGGCKSPANAYDNKRCRRHAHCICEVDGCYRKTIWGQHKCDYHNYKYLTLFCSVNECGERSIPFAIYCENHYVLNKMRGGYQNTNDMDKLKCSIWGGGWDCAKRDHSRKPVYHFLCDVHSICELPGCYTMLATQVTYCPKHTCANIGCSKSIICQDHIHSNMLKWYGPDCYLYIIPQDILQLIQLCIDC